MAEKVNRIKELENIFELSGLQEIFEKQWVKYIDNDKTNFTKLQFKPNLQHICSIEIHETLKGPYFRIHYAERISPHFKEQLKTLPGAIYRNSSDKVNVNLDGNFLLLACGFAKVIRNLG